MPFHVRTPSLSGSKSSSPKTPKTHHSQSLSYSPRSAAAQLPSVLARTSKQQSRRRHTLEEREEMDSARMREQRRTGRLGSLPVPKLKLNSDRGEHSNNGQNAPLMNNKLEGYTEEELAEYRQVFNMFDTDRSGAIGLEELESAMKNLGLEQTRDELDKIIDEVDQRGNHEIDFDEFCEVMRRLYEKKTSWNEVIKQCFDVFDRTEAGTVSKRDFQYVLREFGDITDNTIIEEIFNEVDIDGNGVIDTDEFSYMVRNYMNEEDI